MNVLVNIWFKNCISLDQAHQKKHQLGILMIVLWRRLTGGGEEGRIRTKYNNRAMKMSQ